MGSSITELSVEAEAPGRFACTAVEEGGLVTVSLAGNAESVDRPQLSRVLDTLHKLILESGKQLVRVDLMALKFLNSSCFKDFVTWLTRIDELPSGQRYQVRFQANPAVRWQKGSLHALLSFAPEIASIE